MNELVKSEYNLTPKNIADLEQAGVIPKGTPKAQIEIFAEACKQRGISPFLKHIYLVKYGNIYSQIVGVDGFRFIASKSGAHAGTDDVTFDGLTLSKAKAKQTKPVSATCTVYKIVAGQRVSFTKTVLFSEFAGRGKWASMPFHMIAKVAESHALRMAFPEYLSGLYVPEESSVFNNENNPIQEKTFLITQESSKKAFDKYKEIVSEYENTRTLADEAPEIIDNAVKEMLEPEVEHLKECIRVTFASLKISQNKAKEDGEEKNV